MVQLRRQLANVRGCNVIISHALFTLASSVVVNVAVPVWVYASASASAISVYVLFLSVRCM